MPVKTNDENTLITIKSGTHVPTQFSSNNITSSKQQYDTERMLVWFVLGPIGAGKSSYINKLLLTHNLVFLSPDVLQKRENLSYLEARSEMEKIIQQHIENKISFVIEGTGQHDDLYDLFKSFKHNSSINLKVTYIDVTLEIALTRNKARARILSDDTVRDVFNKCNQRRHLWNEFNCEYINYENIIDPSGNFTNIY